MCRMLLVHSDNPTDRWDSRAKQAWASGNPDGVGAYIRHMDRSRAKRTMGETHSKRFKDITEPYTRLLIHFRLATGGEGTHPFISNDDRFALTHNGTLSDDKAREMLLKDGIEKLSAIDSAVLLPIFLKTFRENKEKYNKKLLQDYVNALGKYECYGTLNIIVHDRATDTSIGVCDNSLSLIRRDGIIMLASDTKFLSKKLKRRMDIKDLNEGECVIIKNNNVLIHEVKPVETPRSSYHHYGYGYTYYDEEGYISHNKYNNIDYEDYGNKRTIWNPEGKTETEPIKWEDDKLSDKAVTISNDNDESISMIPAKVSSKKGKKIKKPKRKQSYLVKAFNKLVKKRKKLEASIPKSLNLSKIETTELANEKEIRDEEIEKKRSERKKIKRMKKCRLMNVDNLFSFSYEHKIKDKQFNEHDYIEVEEFEDKLWTLDNRLNNISKDRLYLSGEHLTGFVYLYKKTTNNYDGLIRRFDSLSEAEEIIHSIEKSVPPIREKIINGLSNSFTVM
mgnify:CR=1 FL=1